SPPRVLAGDLSRSGFKEGTNLLALSTDQVMVEAVRPEDDGVWLVRLAEIEGSRVRCLVKLARGRFRQYAVQEAFNTEPVWLPVENDSLVLDFEAAEFKTLLLRE
ncbi:MAG: hypothetical protein PHT33_12650, partial [bacterium]|nr:hypothetical protein [bacterium]